MPRMLNQANCQHSFSFSTAFLTLFFTPIIFLLSTNAIGAELVEYSRATKEDKFGTCPLLYPKKDNLSTAFRDGLSESCYSCPKGYVRSITSINSSDACVKVDLTPNYRAAKFETKANVPGAFWDPRNGGEWWKCPAAYPRRTLNAVTDPTACATKSLWPNEKLAKATFLGTAKTYPKRSSAAFWDPRNGGEWWSCPAGYFRTVAPVNASNACRKAPASFAAKAVRRGSRGCPTGAFAHGLAGECYSCPDGFSRSLAIGDDLSKLNTACVKVDVAGFADEQIRQRLLQAIDELNLPQTIDEIETTYGSVVQFLETNSDVVAEIVSKEVNESRRKQLVQSLGDYFDKMGKDLLQWNPKSTSLGFAGDASYGIGVAATDPMVAWKLDSNLTSLNDWGLYWAANGSLGAAGGVSVAPEIGYWTDNPRDLAGPAFGVSFGGSVKVGISVTYWWALQAGDPKFLGVTVTPGFGLDAKAEMVAGYTTSYTDGFTSGSAPPANPSTVTQQPATAATQVPLSEAGNYVADGFTMEESWKNYSGYFVPVGVKKSADGLVTFSGLIKGGSFDSTIGRLNQGYRPNKRLIFNLNHHDYSMRVDVLPTGDVNYVAGGNKYGWVNLTGIRFDTNRQGYQNLPLANGWKAYGQNYATPQFKTSGDWVTLSGLVRLPANYKTPIATLPPNARPAKRQIFSANAHETPVRVDVLPNGQVLFVAGSTPHRWISLEGIKFIKASAQANAEKRALRQGWAPYGEGYAEPSVTKVGKTVEISGVAKIGSGDVIAKLPSQYKPAKTMIFNVNNHGKSARVDVRNNGDVVWIAGGKDHGWLSLSGIIFDTP